MARACVSLFSARPQGTGGPDRCARLHGVADDGRRHGIERRDDGRRRRCRALARPALARVPGCPVNTCGRWRAARGARAEAVDTTATTTASVPVTAAQIPASATGATVPIVTAVLSVAWTRAAPGARRFLGERVSWYRDAIRAGSPCCGPLGGRLANPRRRQGVDRPDQGRGDDVYGRRAVSARAGRRRW